MTGFSVFLPNRRGHLPRHRPTDAMSDLPVVRRALGASWILPDRWSPSRSSTTAHFLPPGWVEASFSILAVVVAGPRGPLPSVMALVRVPETLAYAVSLVRVAR